MDAAGRERGAEEPGSEHVSRGVGLGRAVRAFRCQADGRDGKKSLPGDAQKLMCTRIKIAAQSVMWYYFHAVYARGGGISLFL